VIWVLEKVNVALAQIGCKVGDKKHNIRVMKNEIKRAKRRGANLIIFPELSLTGYSTRDLAYELAEPIPGAATHSLEEVTKKENVYVVFGMPEQSEKAHSILYNSAVMLGPEGLIGKYRKMHLPTHSVFEEKRYFRLGYEAPVFDTEIGKIGLTICYDMFFPEICRLLKLKGAQLIVCISASPAVRSSFFEVFTAARALENTVFLAYVNLVGVENGLQFWGGSRTVAPNGSILAKAKYDKEDLVIGTVDYANLERAGAFVPTLRDLRPELFNYLREQAEKL
jgi:predicted amidohydrolase